MPIILSSYIHLNYNDGDDDDDDVTFVESSSGEGGP